MLTDKTSVSYISYLWDSFFLFQFFFLLFLPVSPAFSPLLTVFPCLLGMFASFHSPMPRSALFFLFSSSLFPACGACLPLFTLPCPAPLCFPSFPLHFSLPAGHDCSFSLSHAPLGSVFPLFLFTFPFLRGMFASFHSPMPRSALFSLFSSSLFPARGACLLLFTLPCPAGLCFPSSSLHFSLPAGHDCSFPLPHAPQASVFPLLLFTFPFLRGMIAPFFSLMPRSALFSLFSSSLFPSCGAYLLLFSLPCPAPLCFPSFPLHFSLPAGHDCLFSHSHAPQTSTFSDCFLNDSCQGICSAV